MAASARADGPARAVQVAAAELRAMDRRVTALGSLAAHDQAVLSAKVAGRLAEMRVDLGSEVRQGDLLAVIEGQDYVLKERQARALLVQARARVGLPLDGADDRIDPAETSSVKETLARFEEARRNRERVVRLNEQGVISASELESADAQYKVAENQHLEAMAEARMRAATVLQRRAELDLAVQQLADTRLIAPFDGAIQERVANLGEYLTIGAPLLRIVRLDPLRLRLEVPEREAAAIVSNQPVRLVVAGDPREYTGAIRRVSPAIDERNRMLSVEADVPRQGSLRPGAFARAQIVTRSGDPVVAIPTNALVVFAGIEKAFVVEQGKAVERPVTAGRIEAGYVEILTGLKAGERVVLDPGNLRNGEPVAPARRG